MIYGSRQLYARMVCGFKQPLHSCLFIRASGFLRDRHNSRTMKPFIWYVHFNVHVNGATAWDNRVHRDRERTATANTRLTSKAQCGRVSCPETRRGNKNKWGWGGKPGAVDKLLHGYPPIFWDMWIQLFTRLLFTKQTTNSINYDGHINIVTQCM